MIEYKKGVVKSVNMLNPETQEVILDIDHKCKRAINYKQLTGDVAVGDTVMVNTTACSLGLGTGGYHFVMANLNSSSKDANTPGHGMKMKYTPIQVKVLLAEEEKSHFHNHFFKSLDLTGKLVFIGELHSMLLPLCSYLKYYSKEKIRIAYIMTDHGALPIAFSKTVKLLKDRNLLDTTVTTGNAFGGDYECVNIYTSLQAAFNIEECDIAIVTMGPGILGTSTSYGFSGLELGLYIDFVFNKGGLPLYVPRVSFADSRKRHQGISHHYLNVLREIVQNPIPIVLPIMDLRKMRIVLKQIKHYGLCNKNPIIVRDGRGIARVLNYYQFNPRTMGRTVEQEPDFFYCLGALGRYALSIFQNRK